MLQRITTFFFALSIVFATATASMVGDWSTYLSYHNCTQNVVGGDCIYALTNGSLFSYNIDDTEVRTFSKSDGLNDTDITLIRYSKSEHCLIIIYDDGNIDFLYDNGTIVNLPQFMNSNISDKTINDMVICDKEAILSTQTGVIVINVENKEFSNTYDIAKKVLTAVALKDYIFAFTTEGIYGGNRSTNLLDINNWGKKSRGVLRSSGVIDNTVYAVAGDGLYKISYPDGNLIPLLSAVYTHENLTSKPFILSNSSQVVLYTPGSGSEEIGFENNTRCLTYSDGIYWSSEATDGLQPYRYDSSTNSLIKSGGAITPNSPLRNYFYFMRYTDNRLLVAGGSLNYSAITYKGTLMSFEDNSWTNFDEMQIEDTKGLSYNNMTSIIQDPKDENHHFATAAGTGLYEFENFKMINHYDCDNSSLKSILTNNSREYVRLDGLNYDKNGNLWMTNNEVDTILRVMKPDGNFEGYYIEEIANHPTCEKTLIDSKGRLWMLSRRLTAGNLAGVLCLDYNNTLDDRSDDVYKFRSSIVNEDGLSYTPNLIFSIAEDKNGKIWIGSDKGPFVIENTDNFLGNDFYYNQIKVPRNDGTDYADYLLSDVSITAIAVDGANRKWLGTDVSGVFVVSSDGLETIHHFTKDDSPLLSNNIYSIAIDDESGEVYIGTSKGLVSYRGEATSAASTLDAVNLKITPNPIRPGYQGNIIVGGLTFNAEVKITTVSGKVVASGTSSGGSFEWDGCNLSGSRVASGVYYVMASTSDGSKGATARIVVIR